MPEGNVITTQVPEGVLREGATITLVISRGPEPVTVPNVIGMSWTAGKKVLSDLGFDLKYNVGADAPIYSSLIQVASTDPAAGASLPKGSTITLKPTNPFG